MDAANNIGGTGRPLLVAAMKGHAEAVGLLVKKGANVDAATDGMTPLWLAAYQGHTPIVRTLLLAGADTAPSPGDRTDACRGTSHIAALEVAALDNVGTRYVGHRCVGLCQG